MRLFPPIVVSFEEAYGYQVLCGPCVFKAEKTDLKDAFAGVCDASATTLPPPPKDGLGLKPVGVPAALPPPLFGAAWPPLEPDRASAEVISRQLMRLLKKAAPAGSCALSRLAATVGSLHGPPKPEPHTVMMFRLHGLSFVQFTQCAEKLRQRARVLFAQPKQVNDVLDAFEKAMPGRRIARDRPQDGRVASLMLDLIRLFRKACQPGCCNEPLLKSISLLFRGLQDYDPGCLTINPFGGGLKAQAVMEMASDPRWEQALLAQSALYDKPLYWSDMEHRLAALQAKRAGHFEARRQSMPLDAQQALLLAVLATTLRVVARDSTGSQPGLFVPQDHAAAIKRRLRCLGVPVHQVEPEVDALLAAGPHRMAAWAAKILS